MATRAVPAVFSITMYDPIANHPKNFKEAKYTLWPSHLLQEVINLVKIVVQRFFLSTEYLSKHFQELSIENVRHLDKDQMRKVLPCNSLEVDDHVKQLVRSCFEGAFTDLNARVSDETVLDRLLMALKKQDQIDKFFPKPDTVNASFKSNLEQGSFRENYVVMMIVQKSASETNCAFAQITTLRKGDEFLQNMSEAQLTRVFRSALLISSDNPALSFKKQIIKKAFDHLKKHPKDIQDFVEALIYASKITKDPLMTPEQFEQFIKIVGPESLFQIIKETKSVFDGLNNLQARALAFLVNNLTNSASDFSKSFTMSVDGRDIHFVSMGKAFEEKVKKFTIDEAQNAFSTMFSLVRDDSGKAMADDDCGREGNPLIAQEITDPLIAQGKALVLQGQAIHRYDRDLDYSLREDNFRRQVVQQISLTDITAHPELQLYLCDLVHLDRDKILAIFGHRKENDHKFWLDLAKELQEDGNRVDYVLKGEIQNAVKSRLQSNFFTSQEKATLEKLNSCYHVV